MKHCALNMTFILTALFAVQTWAHAGELGQVQDVAGEWRITYGNGAIRTYVIDKKGQMRGNADDVKVTGHVELKDGRLLLTFNEEDKLERLTLGADGQLGVEHWDPKAGFPKKRPSIVGVGVREDPRIFSSLQGTWGIVYGNGSVRFYTINGDGEMRGTANDSKLTGRIEQTKDQFLLTFSQEDKLERLTRDPDGRLIVEHWDPKADFPEKKPAQVGVGRPVTGKSVPGVDLIDAVMLTHLNTSTASAATLALGRGREKEILFSRGYGWSDAAHKVPIDPDTPMGIASCDKHLTATAIKQLARAGKLKLNDSLLKVLQIKPAGNVVDNRVWNITLQHCLDSSEGWQGDPVDKAWQAANARQFPIEAETLLSHVAVQRLTWTPGEKQLYDSFGYNSLKRVVAKISGKSYVDYLRENLCAPYGVAELKWIRQGTRRKGEPPQLWNGLIMEDPEEYRMGVSMPALCTTMRCYFPMGELRDNGTQNWAFWGGWANVTSEMLYRGDGINFCYAFNGGLEDKDATALEKELHEAINQLIADKRLRLPAKSK